MNGLSITPLNQRQHRKHSEQIRRVSKHCQFELQELQHFSMAVAKQESHEIARKLRPEVLIFLVPVCARVSACRHLVAIHGHYNINVERTHHIYRPALGSGRS